MKFFRGDGRKDSYFDWTEEELLELKARQRPSPGKITRTMRLSATPTPYRPGPETPPSSQGATADRWHLTRSDDELYASALLGVDPTETAENAPLGSDPFTRTQLAHLPGHTRQPAAAAIQRKESGSEPEPAPEVETTGSGEALPEDLRARMEAALGMDFSGVRVHLGPQAQNAGALAFTRGQDIFFAPGQYQPSSQSGQELLGHELTHVVQQAEGRVNVSRDLGGGVALNDDAGLEREADVMGARAAAGQSSAAVHGGRGAHETATSIRPSERPGAGPVSATMSGASTAIQRNEDPSTTAARAGISATGEGAGDSRESEKSVISAERGIRLHKTPSPDDPDYVNRAGDSKKIYSRGQQVSILQRGSGAHAGWSKIQTPDNKQGWIESRYLRKYDPSKDPFTRAIYMVEEEKDTIEGIIKKEYSDFEYKTGNDRRTIAHAIGLLNAGTDVVYYEGGTSDFFKDSVLDRSMAETRQNYSKIKVRGGQELRLPTESYIYAQKELGAIGSRSEWKNKTIGIGRGIEGFLYGVGEGFLDAAVGTVTGLWDLVKGIFTGELLESAYQIYQQLEKEGLEGLWNMIKGVLNKAKEDVVNAWNNPNPRAKWEFFGKIVGMILFEVVLAIFTAGAVTALKAVAKTGKVSKLLSKIPGLKKIVRSKKKADFKLDPEQEKVITDALELKKKRPGDRFKPNQVITDNGYTYKANEFGRISQIKGKLKLKQGKRIDSSNQRKIGKLGNQPDKNVKYSPNNDEGGHLIGDRFGGSGNVNNLVPQNANLNRGKWRAMEEEWAKALRSNPPKKVEVEIEVKYTGDSIRPESFEVAYTINGKMFEKTFINQKGG